MKKSKPKIFIVQVVFVLFISAGIARPAYAGIPVVDVIGNVQAVLGVISSFIDVANGIASLVLTGISIDHEIKDFANQQEKLRLELLNALRPTTSMWSDTRIPIASGVQQLADLDHYKRYETTPAAYLEKYKDLPTYQADPCYSATGCSDAAQLALWNNSRLDHSEAIKIFNDSVIWTLKDIAAQTADDAVLLQNQQNDADLVEGHLAAAYSTNVLVGNVAYQLLSVRTALTAAMYAETLRSETAVDRQAQEDAAAYQLRDGVFTPSPAASW